MPDELVFALERFRVAVARRVFSDRAHEKSTTPTVVGRGFNDVQEPRIPAALEQGPGSIERAGSPPNSLPDSDLTEAVESRSGWLAKFVGKLAGRFLGIVRGLRP